MHQMSPGVERALAGARQWSGKLGSESVGLAHLVLALLDEDEGRPAVLLEKAGLSVPTVRQALHQSVHVPAPPETTLFDAARSWSVGYRHDPEFLTDAFLLTVLRADPAFQQAMTALGLDPTRLESILLGTRAQPEAVEEQAHAFGTFTHTDTAGEMDVARILDANFNRAREATRVIEDFCRFSLNDQFLTEEVKKIRHQLATVAGRLPENLLRAARETQGDVGTAITAGGEYERSSPRQIAIVNSKRLQESLRSLEEFGKLFGAELAQALESLRYRTYTLERALTRGSGLRERLAAARLYVLLTGAQCQASLDWTIEQAAAGGVDIVQLREKSLPDRELLQRARDVRRWTARHGVLFIVNDRADIARLAEADGVHLGQDDLPLADVRRMLGPEALIGKSTHTIEQVREAVLEGADYIGVGPVYPSTTKEFPTLAGLEFVAGAARETSLPAFALGGIGPRNVHDVLQAGARRIAVSAAIAAAEEPEQAARLLRSAIDEARTSPVQ
jgi:thiamine-phosphate pyrophosphorylase